jgi:TonB family protein
MDSVMTSLTLFTSAVTDRFRADGRALSRKPSITLWVLAALGAIAIHASVVAIIYMQLDFSEPDDQLGAPSVEVGLEMLAPHDDDTDLPPGAISEASTASPAVIEQKATPDESNLPRATPMETDDPDQLVSPNAMKKPDEKDPVIKQVEATPSAESVAAEATAPPSSQIAQEAQRSVAPVQGTGQSTRKVITTWQKELVSFLDRHKRYPEGRMRRNADILVSFTLDRGGHVLSTAIVKSSGDASFDEAALAMVRRSDPVPQPPAVIADDALNFTLPVIFREKK